MAYSLTQHPVAMVDEFCQRVECSGFRHPAGFPSLYGSSGYTEPSTELSLIHSKFFADRPDAVRVIQDGTGIIEDHWNPVGGGCVVERDEHGILAGLNRIRGDSENESTDQTPHLGFVSGSGDIEDLPVFCDGRDDVDVFELSIQQSVYPVQSSGSHAAVKVSCKLS